MSNINYIKKNRSLYSAIHYWLKAKYGVASRCENKDCTGKSKNYNWAKKKDKKYDFERDNFIQLCRSCHAKYDFTEDTLKKLKEKNKREKCLRGHSMLDKDHVYIYKNETRCRKCLRIRAKKYWESGGQSKWEKNNIEKVRRYKREWARRNKKIRNQTALQHQTIII